MSIILYKPFDLSSNRLSNASQEWALAVQPQQHHQVRVKGPGLASDLGPRHSANRVNHQELLETSTIEHLHLHA